MLSVLLLACLVCFCWHAECASVGMLRLTSAVQHAQAACKDSTTVAVDAVDLLSQQYFFISTKLASLATDAEIITKVLVACLQCTDQSVSCRDSHTLSLEMAFADTKVPVGHRSVKTAEKLSEGPQLLESFAARQRVLSITSAA